MFLPTVRKSESVRSLTQLLVFRCPLHRPYKGLCVPKDALEQFGRGGTGVLQLWPPLTQHRGVVGEASKRLIQRNLNPLPSPLNL